MEQFEVIEKNFFAINESDYSSLIDFYRDNKEFFSSFDINDQDKRLKTIWILSEIIVAAYKQKDYELIKKTAKSTISLFKDYSLKFNYDLKEDTFYKSLIFYAGINSFENKNYHKAVKYFKESILLDKEDPRFKDFFNESKFRYTRRLSRLLVIIGILLLMTKYILKLTLSINGPEMFLFGYLGAILVIAGGVLSIKIKSPAANMPA
jgi:hypothetical protein